MGYISGLPYPKSTTSSKIQSASLRGQLRGSTGIPFCDTFKLEEVSKLALKDCFCTCLAEGIWGTGAPKILDWKFWVRCDSFPSPKMLQRGWRIFIEAELALELPKLFSFQICKHVRYAKFGLGGIKWQYSVILSTDTQLPLPRALPKLCELL